MGFSFGRSAALPLLVLFALACVVGAVAENSGRWLPRPAAFGEFRQAMAPDPEQLFGKRSLRVLVVGLDYDYTNADIETSAHSRSDIIMAVNIDLAKHRIHELSVPRDMVATLPNGAVAKINQAQSDGGIRESESVVARWLGTPPFDRHVVLRIDTMKDLIDALGGVTVDVENSDALRKLGPNGPIDYDDTWGHLHVHLRPGSQRLTGEGAVGYARFRHDWCSDPCRIMRQQQVVHAIAQRIADDRANTLLHLDRLLGVLHRDVETNFTNIEEISLVSAFTHLRPTDIETAQVPYVRDIDLPGYGNSIVADERAKRALVAKMLLQP